MGGAHDGRDFIDIALKNGASCVVREGLGDLELPDNQLEVNANLRKCFLKYPQLISAIRHDLWQELPCNRNKRQNHNDSLDFLFVEFLRSALCQLGTIGCYFEGKRFLLFR